MVNPLVDWLIGNIPVWVVSSLISAVVAYWFDRRRETGRERKTHFDEIKGQVLQPMLTRTRYLQNETTQLFAEHGVPHTIDIGPPGESSLFDSYGTHLPDIKKHWDALMKNVLRLSKDCIVLLKLVRERFEQETGIKVSHPERPIDDEPSLTGDGNILLYNLLVNEETAGKLGTRLRVETINDTPTLRYDNYVLIQTTGPDHVDRKTLERCEAAIEQLSHDSDMKNQARDLLARKERINQQIEDIRKMMQDTLPEKKLRGKCRYCP
jgi:hypothetical protein